MIFAISRGTNGSGPERYYAYLPFVLALGAELSVPDNSVTSDQGTYKITLEKLHHLYCLYRGPFPSESAAALCVDELRASLLWLSLKSSIGVSYSKSMGELNLFESPKPIPDTDLMRFLAESTGWTATDGHYDADKAMIRPEHKRLARWETGRASAVIGISTENFFATLEEAFSFQKLEGIIENLKLQLSIELYAAYRFEIGKNAQLFTLISSLEALLPKMEVPEVSSNLIDELKIFVKEHRDEYSKESTEWKSITHLLSRVGDLKRESIGENLRSYFSYFIYRHPELGDKEITLARLRDAYSLRSNLLHKGDSGDHDIGDSLSFLGEFVPQLLTILYREATREITA